MKAWIVKPKGEFCSTVVFAETSGKAKSLARFTDCCHDTDFLDIKVSRMKSADKMFKGKNELDWECPAERLFLVKECGWRCEYPEYEDCEACVARAHCESYQDYLELQKEANQ